MCCTGSEDVMTLAPSSTPPCADDDSRRVNVIPTALILITVESGALTGLDDIEAIDDGTPQLRAFANGSMIHDDRFLDIRPLVNAHRMADDTAPHCGVVDHAADPDKAILDMPGDHLRRQADDTLRLDRPAPVIEVECRGGAEKVHMRRPIGREIADITPVASLLVGPHARDFVVQEVIGIDLVAFEHLTNDRAPEVVLGAAAGIVSKHLYKGLRVKDVVTHPRVGAGCVGGHGLRPCGVFLEADDTFILVHFDDAEAARRLDGHWQGGYRGFRPLDPMKVDHLIDIHAIDMVGAKDGY